MNSYALLRSPIEKSVQQLFTECERNIFIASPFINAHGIGVLTNVLAERTVGITVEVLTCVTPKSLQEGSLDLAALVHLCQAQPSTKVLSLPRLHAKVYIVDGCKAIITSANFTRGGLLQNYEYGIALFDKSLVESINDDMRAYAALGSILTLETLGRLVDETHELQTLKKNAERAQRQTDLGKQLRRRATVIQDTLLLSRVRDRPITAIFSDTIRYLLWSGPKTTEELHERIKDIHPDICDNTIDRVINGQRFGKLWKHHVRNAQQALKKRGEITRMGERWQLTGKVG